jgi:hypothetical protein
VGDEQLYNAPMAKINAQNLLIIPVIQFIYGSKVLFSLNDE